MARYNTAPQTLVVTGEQTFTYAFTGGIISLTGTSGYTVTMVSPVFFPGSRQTFYNATDDFCTIATAAGVITGNGVEIGTTIEIPTNSTYVMTSDGTNYVLTSALAGTTEFLLPVHFEDLLDANGKVELNPLDENVEIKPTGSGLVDISPQSSVSIQPGATATIRPTGNLILSSSSGTVSLGDAGKSTSFPGNIDFTANNQTVNLSPVGAASEVTIDPEGNTVIGAGGVLTISSDTLGSLDNVAIGATTPATARVTGLTGTATANFTAGAASTSTTSGSVIVTGGLGVSGRINAADFTGTVGQNTRSAGFFTSIEANSSVSFTANTASTNTTTGTLVVTGGLGVSGTIHGGSIQNTAIGTSTRAAGAFTTLAANSTATFTATTEATSVDTGAVQIDGGVGINKRVYSGGGFQGAIGNVSRSTGQFTTLDANSTVTLSPGANVTISPSGSGTVTLAPAGGGSINNMSIGATTRSTGQFTSLDVSGNLDVARYIRHTGDTNTYLDFETDTISIYVGGSREVTVDGTGVRLGDTGNGYFQPVSGDYGSIQIDGGAHTGWEGYSIGGRAVFMHDNSTRMGLYDDVNNEWGMYYDFNGATSLTHNGAVKLATFSGGTDITGQLRATQQVIAYYSDARLKDVKGNIENALDKIESLNGVLYTQNAKAEEFGYNDYSMQTGLLAQEVQKVLPEVIVPAPFDTGDNGESISGENYMTIQYDRMIPLLVEAIKDLSKQVKDLKEGRL
jgi:hypothetical protein